MSSVGRLCGVRGDPGEDCSLVRPDLAGNSRHGVVVLGTSPADFLKCTMTFFQSISIYGRCSGLVLLPFLCLQNDLENLVLIGVDITIC